MKTISFKYTLNFRYSEGGLTHEIEHVIKCDEKLSDESLDADIKLRMSAWKPEDNVVLTSVYETICSTHRRR